MVSNNVKILLVEDFLPYAEFLQILFEEDGDCTARIAKDGQEAFDLLLRGYLPDLIISDLKMPRMDGHELLTKMMENPRFTSIPFVFLSGNLCSEELRREHRCRATDHISKPFDLDELRLIIKKVEGLARTTKRAA
jgi:CheY-like chemotaxis protein